MSILRVYVPIRGGWFRKKPKPKPTPWAVVWYFDECGRVLYVQPTHDLEKLLDQHKRYSRWHDEMTEVRWQWYPTAREAGEIALRARKIDNPLYTIWGMRNHKPARPGVNTVSHGTVKESHDRSPVERNSTAPAVAPPVRRPRGLPAPGRLTREELG